MRQHLVLAALFATGFGLINMWVSGTDPVTMLAQLPLFFGVMFLTMRAMNRITVSLSNRLRKDPPPPPALPEPTSERPEHAQRRRQRRRRRGRGRRF